MNRNERRRVVTLCKHVYKRGKFGNGGKNPKMWAFSYLDIAVLLGVSVPTVRNYVSKKLFDPTDLVSLMEFAYNKNDIRDPPISHNSISKNESQ